MLLAWRGRLSMDGCRPRMGIAESPRAMRDAVAERVSSSSREMAIAGIRTGRNLRGAPPSCSRI